MADVRVMLVSPERFSFYRAHGVYTMTVDDSLVPDLQDDGVISSDQGAIDALIAQGLTNFKLTDKQAGQIVLGGVSVPIIVTKAAVGLGNVNNTSDSNKPVSTHQAEAIALAKAQAITEAVSQAGIGAGAGVSSQQAQSIIDSAALSFSNEQSLLDKSDVSHVHSYSKDDVGLGNVNNTSDLNKPVSAPQAAAIALAKAEVSGTIGSLTASTRNADGTTATDTVDGIVRTWTYSNGKLASITSTFETKTFTYNPDGTIKTNPVVRV